MLVSCSCNLETLDGRAMGQALGCDSRSERKDWAQMMEVIFIKADQDGTASLSR